jgi:beta-phosphoglucomutase-like phosphatase (HAD superfamily)
MNLGGLAEKIIAAPSNAAAVESALAGIKALPSADMQRRVAQMIFGTPDMARVAREFSPALMAEIGKLMGKLPAGATKAAEDYATAMSRIRESAEGLRNELGVELLPKVTGLIEQFRVFATSKDPETGFTNVGHGSATRSQGAMRLHEPRCRGPGWRRWRKEAHRG